MKMTYLKFAAVLLVAAGSFISCQKEQKKNVTPVTIGKGVLPNGGIESLAKQNITITTKAAWDNLMATMNANGNVSVDFSVTEIDFNTWQGIAVFDEIHANDGWTIDITEVTEYADKIVVGYTNLATGNANLVPTQPYHIVKIPLSNKYNYFKNEPIELPFAEYSLAETSCQWRIFENDTLIIINDDNELEQCMICSDEWSKIDFTVYTLVFVGGTATHGALEIMPMSFEKRENNYFLMLKNNYKGMFVPLVMQPWNVAILVNKISQDIKIQVKWL